MEPPRRSRLAAVPIFILFCPHCLSDKQHCCLCNHLCFGWTLASTRCCGFVLLFVVLLCCSPLLFSSLAGNWACATLSNPLMQQTQCLCASSNHLRQILPTANNTASLPSRRLLSSGIRGTLAPGSHHLLLLGGAFCPLGFSSLPICGIAPRRPSLWAVRAQQLGLVPSAPFFQPILPPPNIVPKGRRPVCWATARGYSRNVRVQWPRLSARYYHLCAVTRIC